MSHRKYKTLEENKTLFLLVLKGKKRWPLPFQKPKNWAAEKRTSSKRWGRKWHKTTVEKEKEKLTEFLGGTTRVPALLYGECLLSLGEINLNQYEVLFFEPLHCYLNHISYVLEELPHHITDVDTLVTLKEALSVALKKDKFRCNNYFRVLLQVTILLSGKSDNSVMDYWQHLLKRWEYFMPKKTPDTESRSCDLQTFHLNMPWQWGPY